MYHLYHPDNKAKGGSAIFIKELIKHYEEQHVQEEKVQLTLVCIYSTKQILIISATYCPPKYQLKTSDYKALFQQTGERFIIVGDYNTKHVDWGSRLTITKGRELHNVIRELGCDYHFMEKPTYWPTDVNKIPDLLDFFITRKLSANFVDIEQNRSSQLNT